MPRNINRPMYENGVSFFRFYKGANHAAWFQSYIFDNRDVIERQLAHVPDNAIRGAYNHTESAALMQWWAD